MKADTITENQKNNKNEKINQHSTTKKTKLHKIIKKVVIQMSINFHPLHDLAVKNIQVIPKNKNAFVPSWNKTKANRTSHTYNSSIR